MSALSWTPVRRGARYCSPRCGRGCTWEEYEQAVLSAGRLVEVLGDGWVPEVWENLGWHYSARRPHLIVSTHTFPEGIVDFTAYLSRDQRAEGGDWTARSRDPREAVLRVIELARRELDSMRSLLRVLEGA